MSNSIRKPILVLIAGFGLLLLSFFAYLYVQITKPMFRSGAPVIIELKANTGAYALVDGLYHKELISSKSLLLKYIQLKDLTMRLKAGVYEIKAGESAHNFIDRVASGDVLQLSFTIIDGSTVRQISQNLQKAKFLKYQQEDWRSVQGNYASAEGQILADTYLYEAGSSAQKLLLKAHKNLNDYLDQAWKTRDPSLPYKNAYELLIAASILEKETALPKERHLIAGVIVNRLKQQMPLQMDPTIVYALGDNYRGKLSHQDMGIDSPFNSYRNRGLPPTPIAMVGKLAIDAAARPEQSAYLYFVARGDGSHEFSKTYEEQKRAISRYLKGN